jgi:hypothetical protein
MAAEVTRVIPKTFTMMAAGREEEPCNLKPSASQDVAGS